MTTDPSSSTPAPVPSDHKPRTLVLCFDGTSDEYDATNTNVVKLYSVLRKDSVKDQLCYYQAGIGTYFAPGVVSPAFRWAAKLLDEAIAWYLYQHVIGGYKFLMQNYDLGDKVCIFGFSRGAYTARALAGMLHKVGLLSKDNVEQVPFAYKLYKSSSKSNETLAQGFKETFCRVVPIDFVGVWDTVASVGVIMGRSLPFVGVNTTIRVFRQALSLDEHRTRFRPSLYQTTPPGRSSQPSQLDAIRPGTDELFNTDVKEVWFAGCHSDIGGGVALNTAEHALSNIPLRWMIEQIVRSECHILFDFEAFDRWHIPRTIGQHEYPSGPTGENRPGGDIGRQDAVQKITDRLKTTPLWWILEILPLKYMYQKDGRWVTTWWPHFGRGRWVPPNPLFHTSVEIRIDDARLGYKPRARYQRGSQTYVS